MGRFFLLGPRRGSNGSTAEPTHKEVKVIRKHCLRLCRVVHGILLLALPVTAALAAGYLDTSFAPPNGYIERDGYSPSTVVQSDGHPLPGGRHTATSGPAHALFKGRPAWAPSGTGSKSSPLGCRPRSHPHPAAGSWWPGNAYFPVHPVSRTMGSAFNACSPTARRTHPSTAASRYVGLSTPPGIT